LPNLTNSQETESLEKYQEPEHIGKKLGAGDVKKLAGSPALLHGNAI